MHDIDEQPWSRVAFDESERFETKQVGLRDPALGLDDEGSPGILEKMRQYWDYWWLTDCEGVVPPVPGQLDMGGGIPHKPAGSA